MSLLGESVVRYWFKRRHEGRFARWMARHAIRDLRLWRQMFAAGSSADATTKETTDG